MSVLNLPKLPYDKRDSVADLDAEKAGKLNIPKKPKAAVPKRACASASRCDLRSHGKCDELHCDIAAAYLVRLSVEVGE